MEAVEYIFLFFVTLANLVLGLVVFLRNKKNKTNIIFFVLSSNIALWSVSIFLFRFLNGANEIIFWGKIAHITAGSTPVLLFYFVKYFSGHKKVNKFIHYLILIIFLVINFFVAVNGYVVSDYHVQYGAKAFIFGPMYLLYTTYIVVFFSLAFATLYNEYRKSSHVTKIQLKYISAGMLISTFLATITNQLFPWFGDFRYNWLGPVFTLIMVALFAYTIVKHKLLDIRLIILRTISYSFVVIFVSSSIVVLTLFLPEVVNATTSIKSVISIAVSIFIVLILDPLKRWIAKVTDKFFFKARVDYQKLSGELSEIINREIDLDILLFSLTHRLEKDLKIKNVSIYLAGSTGGAFYKRIGRVDKTGHKVSDQVFEQLTEEEKTDIANRIRHDNPLIKYLRSKQDIIVLEALERKIEDTQDEESRKILESSKASLDSLDAAVVAPVTVGNTINAVMVLGPKLSGDPFGSEDLNVLSLIGPQLASALEKSRLYEEAQQFTERLKKEVAVATGDLRNANMQLQERNRFLQALQKVTTLISRTLDFAKVTQSVVDSIASELGYLGGVLLLLGKDRHKLFPEAVTRTALTEKALKLLPKPINEYYGYYPEDNSLSVQAISTGKVQISEKLSDFISPAVPAAIAFGMQKLAGIRTVVGVPVYSENEIVGVINFMLQQDHGELKATDVDAMKALAGQTGIVYRNIQLYKQIEESNKHLEVANKHLQQLDQAKSEFVSITSHQLRTPMTGIMGYLSMITQGDFGKVPAEQLKILQGLLEESQRMIRLINLFLNVSKIESGKMTLNRQHMPIDPLIEKVVAMSKKTATDKGLELTYRKPKEPMPEVFADADKLGDVIMNLVDNAIKYTDTGSVTVTSNVDGAYIETTIQDTGRGIDPEEAKKLFTKFVRGFGIAQVNPDGSGLGLYVARRLTEAHDGRIWVESEGKGKGARFHVRIPIYKEGMKEAAEKVESGDVDLTTGG